MADRPEGRSTGIRSLDSGLQLLQSLRERPSLSVNEAARLLGAAPSTAHRLLSTLKARGFVVQDSATRRYRAGHELLDVAFAALRNLDVRRVARPHLESLARELRETANLVTLEDASIRYVEVVESPERLRFSSRVGEIRPAHCSASGKVLLSVLSSAQIDRAFPCESLAPLTNRSISSKSQLLMELEQVRRDGYAWSIEESVPGLSALAAGIRDPLGNVLAAVAVAGPSPRLTGERAPEVVSATRRCAVAIEADMEQAGD